MLRHKQIDIDCAKLARKQRQMPALFITSTKLVSSSMPQWLSGCMLALSHSRFAFEANFCYMFIFLKQLICFTFLLCFSLATILGSGIMQCCSCHATRPDAVLPGRSDSQQNPAGPVSMRRNMRRL